MKNEIVLFEAKDGKVSLPVLLNEETVCGSPACRWQSCLKRIGR
jgi:hypothetical protein